MAEPSLTVINPSTGQPYTAIELADAQVQRTYNQSYGGLPGSTSNAYNERATVQGGYDDFSKYLSTGYIIGQDNEEQRAQLQPWTEQLWNSTQKMAGIAATTFLDGTAGLAAGLINVVVGDREQGSAYNRFIDNDFSNAMLDWQKKMELALPNYRTKQEEENSFYENMFSATGAANFWGESVIKNLGFAMGAMGAGVVTGIGLEKALGMAELRTTSKLLEGLSKSIQEGKTLTAAETKIAASLTEEGLASLKNGEVLNELTQTAKAIKSKTAINQAVSSFVGSVGEGRIEALQNSGEFKDVKTKELKDALDSGEITVDEFTTKLQNLDKEVENYQNSLFTANVALLSLSNYTQYKNVFAKSYTPNKLLSNEIINTTEKGLYEVVEKSKFRSFMDYSKQLIKDPLMEMTEEQGQFMLQKAADSYYSMRLDDEANGNVQNFIKSIGKGFSEAYGTEEGWENAFSGFLIGGLGIPTIKKSSNKLGLSVGLAGGMYGEYKEIKDANAKFRKDVDTVNTLLEGNITKQLYDSQVIDNKLESMNKEAVVANDKITSKTISAMQLANTVDAFISIGKYDDLITKIKDENELTADEIKKKYDGKVTSQLTGKESIVPYFKGMTDQQIKEYIERKSDKAVKQAEVLKKIKQDIDIRFGDYPEGARKDLFLKAAAVQDIDERITELLLDVKTQTGNRFARGINKNFTPEMVLYMADFNGLNTPVDLEQFLKKKKGLENYRRLLREYLDYEENNPEQALKFAEKARDLYGLVLQRQAMNDGYFKMADKRYAENAEALANSAAEEKFMGQSTKDIRYKQFYDAHTNEDEEFGFESSIFQVDTDEEDVLTVEGIANKTGAPVKLENARPVTENPKLVDEEGNAVVRTSKAGDKYATYKATVDGKEVTVEVKNPVETKTKKTNNISLRYLKGDANTMVDQDGNVYNLEDLEQDPAFLKSKIITRDQQRQDLYDKIRIETLQKLLKNNYTLAENILKRKAAIQEKIKEAEELLKRAKANKTGRVSVTLDGIRTTFTIFSLEKTLADYKAELSPGTIKDETGGTRPSLEQQRLDLFEENKKAMRGIEEAKNQGFNRAAFNKAILEDVATLQKQIKDVQDARDNAQATADRLQEVIDALKAAVRVIYPKFRALYQKLYGVDPKILSENGELTLRGKEQILKDLRADEIALYSELRVEESKLQDVLDKLNEIQKYMDDSQKMADSLMKERALFEDELAARLAARRASQSKTTPKKAEPKGYTKEIDAEQDNLASEFVSPKPSVKQAFKTAGRDTMDDGTPNPNKAQQRWSKTVSRIKLNDGAYSLRVLTADQRPDLFIDAEGNPLPPDMMKEALAVVLYRNGKPVDANLQPLGEDATEDQLVYNFIPLPKLQSTVKGKTYDKFYDSEQNPELAAAMMQKLEDFRNLLFERAKAGTNSFLPVTSKSLGLLDTTGAKRTGDRDLTTAVWDTLLGGDESTRGKKLAQSRIEIAKATSPEDVEQGWGWIVVGGKEVKVKNGLAYFITNDDIVVPLLSRKLTASETQTAFDLLVAMTESEELSLTPEGAEEVKTTTTTKKKKGKSKFVKLKGPNNSRIKNEGEARAAAARLNKKTGKYYSVYYNKGAKAWGYNQYEKTKLTKEQAEAARKAKSQDSIKIYDYLKNLLYFGKQTRSEESLLPTNANPQTEIYLKEGKLHFYDLEKKAQISIDFTAESLTQNQDTLMAFLANKYHQISNTDLNKKGTHLEVTRVVFDENGKPLYVETAKHTNYTSYLISNKDSNGNTRRTENIPLTTNARTDVNNDLVVKSTYLGYSEDPAHIKEQPSTGTTKTATPGAPVRTSTVNAERQKVAELLAEVEKHIGNKTVSEPTVVALANKIEKESPKINNLFEQLAADDAIIDDEFSTSLKEEGKEQEYEVYQTLLGFRQAGQQVLQELDNAAPVATSDEDVSGENVNDDVVNQLLGIGTNSNIVDDANEEDIEVFGDEDTTEEDDSVDIPDEEDDEEEGLRRTQVTGSPVIDINKAKAWLAENLPQVKVKIHEKLINSIAQGKLSIDGLLHISKLAEEGSEYHEALHGVMLGILTDEELKEVYDEAKKLYGEPTEADLAELKKIYPKYNKEQLITAFYDEKLAEDFRTYALSGGKEYPTSTLGKIFRTILDAIKAFLNLRPSGAINGMFYDLYNGKYKERKYDLAKVKSRLQGSSRFSTLTWAAKGRTVDPVTALQFTKEVTHVMVGNLFKVLFNDNNSIADLKRMRVKDMEVYLNDALVRTKMQIDAQPETQFTKVFNAFYANKKNTLKTAVREYLQNDLGIDLGLYKEEAEDELSKTSSDAAWSKDNSTIHPREGTNAFVKLMVASLPSYIRDVEGNMIQEKGTLLNMPMLVNPNSVFNHLLSILHTSTTFNDPGDSNSMVAVLSRTAEEVPYIQHLLSLLTDETNLAKDPLEANNLITAFQQSMYKTALNYKLWLINEGDVISKDPNSESAEDRTIANWRAKLVESVNTAESIIIKPKDGGAPKVNTKNVAKIANSSRFKPNTFEYYMDVLNKLGITFNVRNEADYTKEEVQAFMENAKYLIEEMRSTIQGDRDLDYIFNKTANGRLFALAAIAAGKNYENTDLQHIGPDGKTRYGISEHNMISMLSEFINSMPVGTPLSALIDKDFGKYPGLNSVYLNNSHFIQNVLFEVGPDGNKYRTNVPFKVTIIEGARPNKPGEEGAVNTKSDKRDRTWMSFNSILKGVFPILRTSDKSLEYAIDLGNPIIELGKVNQRNSEMRNIFKGYLADELLLGKQPTDANIANFTKNLGDGVYFFQDILSGKVPAIRPDESVRDYILKNENLINKAIDAYFVEHDASVIERLKDNNLISYENRASGTYVTMKALDKGLTELLEKANINVSKTDKGVTLREADFNNLIRAFTLSSLIGNIEQTKLFFGHPAFYKTTVDLYKRTAGAVGTKKVAIVDERMNTFIRSLPRAEKDNKVDFSGRVETIVLEEPVTISSYLAEIRKSFIEKYGAERGKKYADKYANMDEADGQGYITLPEYREFRARMGEWGRVEEDLYQKAMRGEKINPAAISTTFNILKAQYFGLNKVDGLSVPVYLKFSLMPLIPSVYAGSNIESTAESMMANGQGIAVYPSAIKVGALYQKDGDFYPMYQDIEDTGEYVGNPIDPKANVLSLDYRFMGLQVATNAEIKQNNTRGSQQSKLIVSDRYEDGVCQPITIFRDNESEPLTPEATDTLVKEYHNTANAITEKKAQQVLKEIGATEVRPGVYRITNASKVSKRLIQAARNRNSPENLIDSLQTEELENEVRFKYLLDGVPNRNKIENLLFSIINNTVVTQKFNGGARIQAASTGFEKGPRTYDFKDGKARLTSNPELRFYTKGALGETLPAQVKMAPNKDMMKLIQKAGGIDIVNAKLKKLWELKYDEDGNVSKDSIRYNEKAIEELELGFDPAILQFVGYRIPTQGMNTIEHLEIAEFLDPLAGEAIHLPSEIVAKSGGDYDIDKLSIYLKYFDENGNPSLDTNTLEGLHNKLIRINQDFLRAPENYNDLLIPNDPATLKALAGEEAKVSKTQSLTWGHNLDTGEYYLVGKDAVGIVARHRTHHTLTQQANVTINKVYKGGMNKDENTSSVLNFEGCENNYSLAGINDVKKENKIGDIISEFLSAFVDVAKDPFVFRINAFTSTADTYMYLIRRGVPIEIAVKFMTQPVIIEYFRTLAGNSSMVDKMNGTDRSSYDIIKELEAKLSTAFKALGGDADKIAGKVFSTEDLAKNVNKKMDDNLSDITFLRSQIQVLKDFRRYTEQASNLRELMDATSDDTVRHKNFNALDSYAKRMDQVRKSAMFDMSSVQRIFDNTLVGGFQKAQMLHEAYRSLFEVTENPKIKTALDNLRDYLIQNKVNEDSINTILDKAKNDLIVHVFSSQITDVNKLLENFFTSESAVANEISKTLKSPNPAIRNNPFLKSLVPLLENPRSDVKGLKTFNVKLTTFDFNQMVNGYRALSEVYQKKLAVFILLQSGLDNSSDTWYDKVPVDVMHNVLEKGIVNFTSTLDTFDTDHFLQEFVRNNTVNFDLVPSIGVYKAGNAGYVKIDKTGTLTGLGQSGLPKKYQNRLFLKVRVDYPEFAGNADAMSRAKVVGIPTGEYLLLVKDPRTGAFKLANKAGDRLMKEFKGVKTPSLLNRNNISKGMFRDEFSKWSEPEMPTVPKNSNTLSQGEALQKEC